jgi:hypothetical protein
MDDKPELRYAGGYYLADGERRTRLYISPAGAERAWERGERYTAAEYRELTELGNAIRQPKSQTHRRFHR